MTDDMRLASPRPCELTGWAGATAGCGGFATARVEVPACVIVGLVGRTAQAIPPCWR